MTTTAASTKVFRITSRTGGADLGVYEGDDARAAVEVMWTEAGYRAPFDSPECDEDDLRVVEVTE